MRSNAQLDLQQSRKIFLDSELISQVVAPSVRAE
jgi:hypothetical protein